MKQHAKRASWARVLLVPTLLQVRHLWLLSLCMQHKLN